MGAGNESIDNDSAIKYTETSKTAVWGWLGLVSTCCLFSAENSGM